MSSTKSPARRAAGPASTPDETASETSASADGTIAIRPKLDLRLVGTITALAPIHISRVDDPDETKGCPTIRRAAAGGVETLPFLPGETLKGLLRSRSGDLVAHVSGQALVLPEYYMLFKGGIKNSDSEGPADIGGAIALRQSNPVFGLYGMAHPRWVGGSLRVGAAVPESGDDATMHRASSARRDDFKASPERVRMLDDGSVQSYLDQRDMEKARSAITKRQKQIGADIRKIVAQEKKGPVADGEERKAALRAEELLLAERLQALKDDGLGNTVGRTLSLQSIGAGSRFANRISAFGATYEEIGLLVETLRSIRHDCRLGGKRSTGYGAFEAKWTLGIRSDPFADFEYAGDIELGPDVFSLTSPHQLLEAAVAAWNGMASDPARLRVSSLAEAA